MAKKIKLNSVGYMTDEGTDVSTSVFERPVMLVYEGEFDSMDGPVTIREEHINLLAKNHNSLLERVKRLATGDIPMRDCPPLQLDHSTSARDTIGRLVGALSVGNIEMDGKTPLALFGTARFLGQENVEKAKDGRYTHVSIGADLESGVINELSVTPFPAAPNASLLSKLSAEEEKEKPMHEKLKKHLMDSKKMSEADADKLSKECLAHQMSKMGLDEEKMGKHLAGADDKEMSRMSDEHDEDKKKLAAKDPGEKDEEEDKDKKMARRAEFTKLALGIKSGAASLRSELRKSTVASRLARLRNEAKITPAEIKKLDVVKMAALTDGEMEAALSTFESREPIIRFGSLSGTNKGETIDKITKKYRLQRMEMESRMNMPSKRAEASAQLSKLAAEEKKELAEVGNSNENDGPTKGMLTKMTFEDLCAMVDDKGKHEELKKHLMHMMDHHGVEVPEHSDAHMSTLAKKQAELQTNLEQLIALASPVLGIKSEELK